MSDIDYIEKTLNDVKEKLENNEIDDLREANEVLNKKDDILFFGVEYISLENTIPYGYPQEITYINSGDTYNLTIIEDNEGYHVTTFGDYIQDLEDKIYHNENKTRCGYCGKFTPIKHNDVHKTICEYCDNNVMG